MNRRADFRSIQQYLPVTLHASDVFWPPTVAESLKSLSKGPSHSNVSSGELFAAAIVDLRKLLGLDPLHPTAPLGFSLFFNDLMNKDDALKWFGEVVPQLANLLLRLPALLEAHYKNADALSGTETGLRVLEVQNPGIVILSQDLIAALLACGLFCLFPAAKRGGKKPKPINFDKLFVILYQRKKENQESKIKCLVHYFERVCKNMPRGNVSFERKVLPLRNSTADYWSKSSMPLCKFEVHTYGKIEDQSTEVLEVDFADKHIGGLILKQGCVQEEIRFAINPELIASILFLPVMADNEAIEIVGPERFSNYTGYRTSFHFSGDYEDTKGLDAMGRRRTRVVAIDALRNPGDLQFGPDCLLREVNKAFCGFGAGENRKDGEGDGVGVATGNWGCGVFGGDPQIKVVIQWLAASQASRPFVLYYTFGLGSLERLGLVVEAIEARKWSVGELWSRLVDYSGLRARGGTKAGFFKWLVPSLYEDGSGDVETGPAKPARGRGRVGSSKQGSVRRTRKRKDDEDEEGDEET